MTANRVTLVDTTSPTYDAHLRPRTIGFDLPSLGEETESPPPLLASFDLIVGTDALGVSRRTIAYYSNGEKKVPKPILLACRGWEVSDGMHQAA